MRLPHIQYPKKSPKLSQERFSGIERDVYSGDGSVHDMLDISTSDFPLLSTIPNRKKLEKKYNKPWYFGMAADNTYVISGEEPIEENKYPLWSATTDYSKDDTVAYNGHLYDAVNEIKGSSDNASPNLDGTNWNVTTKTNFEYDGDWIRLGKPQKNEIWNYDEDFYVNKTGRYTPAYDNVNWTGTVSSLGLIYEKSYSSDKTYDTRYVVFYDGHYYKSKQNGNKGHTPFNDSKWWEMIDWDHNKEYKTGDYTAARESGHLWFRKNISGNNTNPSTDTDNWELFTSATFYYGGRAVDGFVLESSKKECSYLNGYIVIMPDKAYYHVDSGTFGYLAGSKSGEFKTSDYKGFAYNGKFFSYPLEAYLMHGEKTGKDDVEGTYNAIVFVWESGGIIPGTRDDENFGMFDLRNFIKSGDVITVTQNTDAGRYSTRIIEGSYTVTNVLADTVVFTTSTFAGSDFGSESEYVNKGTSYWYLGDITLSKGVPDMDYLCVSNNRMWGCKEDTVYGSALGDCFSWYRYTDESGAVYLETGDAGSFTGCCEYGGYPTFFKQNEMYRVYGNTRSAFSLAKSAEYGIRSDSPHSVCVVNSILFFLSESGVCAYTGGIPSVISDGLKRKLTDAVAGTDGKRYYLMTDDGDGRKMYVYDTDNRIWSCENLDNKPIGVVTYNLKLVAMDVSGEQIVLSHPENATEEEIEPDRKAYIEFNDFYGGSVDKKIIGKVIIRASVNPIYNPLEVYIQYDSDGQWQKIGQIYNQNERKKVSEFSFRPRRCDHYRLRLECKGKFTLYSLARQTE